MRPDILTLCLIVGACTYGLRYLPTRLDLSGLKPGGLWSRFLAATGPAAIATLFVAAILPWARAEGLALTPPMAGVAAVLAVFAATRSVVTATLCGSAAYGLVFAVL